LLKGTGNPSKKHWAPRYKGKGNKCNSLWCMGTWSPLPPGVMIVSYGSFNGNLWEEEALKVDLGQ